MKGEEEYKNGNMEKGRQNTNEQGRSREEIECGKVGAKGEGGKQYGKMDADHEKFTMQRWDGDTIREDGDRRGSNVVILGKPQVHNQIVAFTGTIEPRQKGETTVERKWFMDEGIKRRVNQCKELASDKHRGESPSRQYHHHPKLSVILERRQASREQTRCLPDPEEEEREKVEVGRKTGWGIS